MTINIIKVNKYLKIIDKIEKIRSKNNVNWTDVLKLLLKNAPANLHYPNLGLTLDESNDYLLKKYSELF